ncbi:MAG: response regulator transcription factor [Pseudomonadales bacterium]|nr:response regulator transcription factor [Pseudomonadales bacterium]
MIQIVVVEDDVELQQSLCKRLNSVDDFECSHCFSGRRNAVSQIPELHPDVVLMDINLPDMSGVDCVATLMNQQPHLKILMFTAFENGKDVFAAFKADASGYIVKRHSFAELLEGIRDVLNGGAPMTPSIARKVVQSFRPTVTQVHQQELTKREEEVLALVAKGLQNKEVAGQLYISSETVRSEYRLGGCQIKILLSELIRRAAHRDTGVVHENIHVADRI